MYDLDVKSMNFKTIGVYMDRVVTDNTYVLCMIGWYHASVVIFIIFFSTVVSLWLRK